MCSDLCVVTICELDDQVQTQCGRKGLHGLGSQQETGFTLWFEHGDFDEEATDMLWTE